MSAPGSGPLPPFGLGPVFGASPLGHGISVKAVSPVALVRAKNSLPAGDSESKSMISRWKSSGVLLGLAAPAKETAEAGSGLLRGSNPVFCTTQARSTGMWDSFFVKVTHQFQSLN
jgi:hypothetical protein